MRRLATAAIIAMILLGVCNAVSAARADLWEPHGELETQDITWTAPDHLRPSVRIAFSRWEAVSGIVSRETFEHGANVIVQYDSVPDSRPAVIGCSNIHGIFSQCTLTIDPYYWQTQSYENNIRTMTHEIGHAIGLDHSVCGMMARTWDCWSYDITLSDVGAAQYVAGARLVQGWQIVTWNGPTALMARSRAYAVCLSDGQTCWYADVGEGLSGTLQTDVEYYMRSY